MFNYCDEASNIKVHWLREATADAVHQLASAITTPGTGRSNDQIDSRSTVNAINS